MTPLIWACQNGDEACVRALIDANAAVDAANNRGDTALILACNNGHEACARMLIDANAAVDAVNSNGDTVLMKATLEFAEFENEQS